MSLNVTNRLPENLISMHISPPSLNILIPCAFRLQTTFLLFMLFGEGEGFLEANLSLRDLERLISSNLLLLTVSIQFFLCSISGGPHH